MSEQPFSISLVDPMTAFYAAVTAVENGGIGEVDIEYQFPTTTGDSMTLMISVRRESRVFSTCDRHRDE